MRGGEVGGEWWVVVVVVVGGEEGRGEESMCLLELTRNTAQNREDESGGRGLLADRLHWLCFISQLLHPADLWTLRLSNTTGGRQLPNQSETKEG